jgi:transcriptional regulator with XRE-family HTH domain
MQPQVDSGELNVEPGVVLARRLKDLRAHTFAQPITQSALAAVLGVKAQSVSSWEREDRITVIPVRHLQAYARFFAVESSADDGRLKLLDRDDLSDDELRRAQSLERELADLRRVALGDEPAASDAVESISAGLVGLQDRFWQFSNNRSITIVCAQLPEEEITDSPLTNPRHPDYVVEYTYSDVGALMEIYGHLRAVNPQSDVKIRAAHSELMSDDYTDHLVLLGGVDFNHVTQNVMRMIDIPVTQGSRPKAVEAGAFSVAGVGDFGPTVHVDQKGNRTLLRDVGHFYRGPNPFNKLRTVTICNGMHGRGVLGAVRATTDPKFRDRNAEYIRERVVDGGSVSLLFWVAIAGAKAVTPDWTLPDTVLHETPERPGLA